MHLARGEKKSINRIYSARNCVQSFVYLRPCRQTNNAVKLAAQTMVANMKNDGIFNKERLTRFELPKQKSCMKGL